jgi:hypothetical protein
MVGTLQADAALPFFEWQATKPVCLYQPQGSEEGDLGKKIVFHTSPYVDIHYQVQALWYSSRGWCQNRLWTRCIGLRKSLTPLSPLFKRHDEERNNIRDPNGELGFSTSFNPSDSNWGDTWKTVCLLPDTSWCLLEDLGNPRKQTCIAARWSRRCRCFWDGQTSCKFDRHGRRYSMITNMDPG